MENNECIAEFFLLRSETACGFEGGRSDNAGQIQQRCCALRRPAMTKLLNFNEKRRCQLLVFFEGEREFTARMLVYRHPYEWRDGMIDDH